MLVCALLVKMRLFTQQVGGLRQKAALASKYRESLAVHLEVDSSPTPLLVSQEILAGHFSEWIISNGFGQ